MIPTGHYRPGRLGTVDVLVLHTAEGATTTSELAAYFAGTDRLVSAHSVVDDHGRLDLLGFDHTAFAAPGANADGEQLELCALAAWSTAQWRQHPGLLEQTARWLAERCAVRRIPPRILTPAQLRDDQRGIATHAAVSAAFRLSNHTDPGPAFPLLAVVERVNVLLTPKRPAPAVPTRAAPPYPGTPLRPGSHGAAVALWQRRLRSRGWRMDVDGYYGPVTGAVTRAFQHDKRLVVDGIVGPASWRAAWSTPVTR